MRKRMHQGGRWDRRRLLRLLLSGCFWLLTSILEGQKLQMWPDSRRWAWRSWPSSQQKTSSGC